MLLADEGKIFGVKFHPGAFHPFFNRPISEITDRSIDIIEVFGNGAECLEMGILSSKSENTMVDIIESFLISHLPSQNPHQVESLNKIINNIESDQNITRVYDILTQFNINK